MHALASWCFPVKQIQIIFFTALHANGRCNYNKLLCLLAFSKRQAVNVTHDLTKPLWEFIFTWLLALEPRFANSCSTNKVHKFYNEDFFLINTMIMKTINFMSFPYLLMPTWRIPAVYLAISGINMICNSESGCLPTKLLCSCC